MAQQDDYLNSLTPDELALQLGQWRPSYNSNEAGSAETNYSNYLNKLTPDQLLKRYSSQGVTIGSNVDQANKQAYDSFVSLIGRAPTANELAQAIPYFQGPSGINTGRSYLATLSEQLKNSPDALAARAPQYSGEVGGIFQQLLNRGATPEELDYFGRQLATGQITPYEVQQFVKQGSEYQTGQDTQFREGLKGDLLNYNQDLFNRSKGDILSEYASRGITNSPSLDYAMTDLLGKISSQSTPFLAGVSSQQYGGNKEAARQDYQNSMENYMNNLNYNRNLNQQNMNALTQRSWNAADYQTQQNDLMRMMGSQKQGGYNPLYGALGGILGAGIGGFASHSPQGAMVGYQAGQGLGNSWGYLNS